MAREKININEKKTERFQLVLSPNKVNELLGRIGVHRYLKQCLNDKEKIKQFIKQQNK